MREAEEKHSRMNHVCDELSDHSTCQLKLSVRICSNYLLLLYNTRVHTTVTPNTTTTPIPLLLHLPVSVLALIIESFALKNAGTLTSSGPN